jgi:hypothetical protein
MADYKGGYNNIRGGNTSEKVIQSPSVYEAELKLSKTVLVKNSYPESIDITFSELITPPPPLEDTISVEEFFNLYKKIFYDIPAEGDVNSHQFIIERSTEYLGLPETQDEEFQILLDEITSLRQNLLDTEKEVFDLQNPTNQSTNLSKDSVSSNIGVNGNEV